MKKRLIEEGLFTRTRNPNYVGEILIYTSCALMSLHWLPFLILAGWVFGFFVRNMHKKDQSLSRHPQLEPYRKRAGQLFPKLNQRSLQPCVTKCCWEMFPDDFIIKSDED